MREKTSDVLSGNKIKKPVTFKLLKRRSKPSLTGRYYPSIKRLPSYEEVYDSSTETTRTIRYAVGESSIYKDEQPNKVVLGDIIFQNGFLRLDHTNPTLLKYLAVSNLNSENPDRKSNYHPVFIKLDPEKDAELSMEKEISQARAISTVASMEFGELKAYARVLGVNIDRGVSEIKHDMLVLAKASPDSFIAGLDDPLTKRQQVVLDAIEYGIINITGRASHWKMGDKQSLIVPIPLGQDSVVWFAEWTMSDKEGQKVFDEITKKVKKFAE